MLPGTLQFSVSSHELLFIVKQSSCISKLANVSEVTARSSYKQVFHIPQYAFSIRHVVNYVYDARTKRT